MSGGLGYQGFDLLGFSNEQQKSLTYMDFNYGILKSNTWSDLEITTLKVYADFKGM